MRTNENHMFSFNIPLHNSVLLLLVHQLKHVLTCGCDVRNRVWILYWAVYTELNLSLSRSWLQMIVSAGYFHYWNLDRLAAWVTLSGKKIYSNGDWILNVHHFRLSQSQGFVRCFVWLYLWEGGSLFWRWVSWTCSHWLYLRRKANCYASQVHC